MYSKITSKYQVTIPKAIRERLKLSVSSVIDWKVDEDNKVVVMPVESPLMKWRGFIKAEPGDIKEDIRKAWKIRAERYR